MNASTQSESFKQFITSTNTYRNQTLDTTSIHCLSRTASTFTDGAGICPSWTRQNFRMKSDLCGDFLGYLYRSANRGTFCNLFIYWFLSDLSGHLPPFRGLVYYVWWTLEIYLTHPVYALLPHTLVSITHTIKPFLTHLLLPQSCAMTLTNSTPLSVLSSGMLCCVVW
jgi:hypothetical protein